MDRPEGQCPGQRSQGTGGQARAEPVELARAVHAFIDETPGDQDGGQGHGDVDIENGAPADAADQPAAQRRPDRARDRAGCGPGSDRAAARFASKGTAQDAQTVGHQEGRADALRNPCRQQDLEIGGERAAHRSQGKYHDPADQHSLATELIASRTAQQQQRRQGQQIGVDHPRQVRGATLQIAGDRRQCDVGHRSVDKCQARRQHGRDDRPVGMARRPRLHRCCETTVTGWSRGVAQNTSRSLLAPAVMRCRS